MEHEGDSQNHQHDGKALAQRHLTTPHTPLLSLPNCGLQPDLNILPQVKSD